MIIFYHLLFSYHGIPERHIRKSDITKSHCKVDGTCCDTPSIAHEFCYSHQCKEVTKLVAKKLKLKVLAATEHAVHYVVSPLVRWPTPPAKKAPKPPRVEEKEAPRAQKKIPTITPDEAKDLQP